MDDATSAPHLSPHRRRQAGIAAHALVVLLLVPAFLWLAPASRWDQPLLLGVLAALALVAARHDVPLPNGIRFDALVAVALIAVAVGGPLPALAIALLPIAVDALLGREQLLRAGNLANLAAYGAYVLVGALLLELAPATGPTAFLALVGIGLTQLFVNWAVGPAIYGTLWVGHPFRALVDMLRDALPAGAAMLTLGAATVLLVHPLGLAALLLFAVIAVLPQSVLTFALRTRPVARLERATATRRYTHALALQLGLSRAERRHVAAVARAANLRPATGEAIDYVHASLADRSRGNLDAQTLTEWWNGHGGPLGLRAESIPLAARVIAVADTWSALTAAGTPQLAHQDAISHLEAAAGARLDPRVVAAASAVVEHERVSADEPAPEPRLHRLPIPASLRRALAAAPA